MTTNVNVQPVSIDPEYARGANDALTSFLVLLGELRVTEPTLSWEDMNKIVCGRLGIQRHP